MSIIKINGEDIPSPLPFEVALSDQDLNSKMDGNGDLHRNRIAVKRKINLEWGPLSNMEIRKILMLTEEVFFNCTYPDPKTGKFETKRFYISDRTAPICSGETEEEIEWLGLKANLVEK